jgi:hypothetical protein
MTDEGFNSRSVGESWLFGELGHEGVVTFVKPVLL